MVTNNLQHPLENYRKDKCDLTPSMTNILRLIEIDFALKQKSPSITHSYNYRLHAIARGAKSRKGKQKEKNKLESKHLSFAKAIT